MGGMASYSKISTWVSTEQLGSQTRAVPRKVITIIRYRVQLYKELYIYRTRYNYIDIYSSIIHRVQFVQKLYCVQFLGAIDAQNS